MLQHVFKPGGTRKEPAVFLLLTLAFLAVAGAGIVWRACGPTDGTTVNVNSVATAAGAVAVQEVASGSPLRVGDEIVAISGVNLGDTLGDGIGGQSGQSGQSVTEGQTLRYDIVRDGQAIAVDVPLRAYPVVESILRGWPSLLVNLTLLVTAAVIFLLRPHDPAAHAAITASAIGAATIAWSGYFQLEAVDLVAGSQFWRWYGGQGLFALLWAGMVHFALAFPEVTDRRRYRSWSLGAYLGSLASYVVFAGVAYVLVDDPIERLSLTGSPALPSLYVYPVLVLGVLIGQYVRHRDPLVRRRLHWMALSLSGGAALYLSVWIVPMSLSGTPLLPMEYHTLSFLPVPLAVAMAILRHRALNIEVVLSRSLVYGTLTVLLAGGYIGVVGALSLAFPPLDQLWQQAFAAAVIALAIQPLRSWLQSLVNTRLFGEPSDPYRVVSALASRLEDIHTPSEQLSAVVETIGAALRLPYVAIELNEDADGEPAASYGSPTALSHRLPLSYQGEPVGQLVIARRGAREVLGRKERSVLAEVARHAGTVVYTAWLTTDLVRSRDRLVSAREEERRRLLRELHDGVGPTLAAITLGLHAARRAIGDAAPSAVLLGRLQEALNGAITEIRRLAHGLRPPILEKLGLVAALEDYIDTINRGGDESAGECLTITLQAPEQLPPLPPAVDVAAYRIVCEALTNVTRHADARKCTVELRIDDALSITVTDDGVGLRDGGETGIGLGSMRERAAELGGEFRAEQLDIGGTRVFAYLPLPEVEP